MHNTGSSDVYVYFTAASINRLILPQGQKLDMDVKCTSLYAETAASTDSGIQIFAEVTNIPTARMYSLTGLEGV